MVSFPLCIQLQTTTLFLLCWFLQLFFSFFQSLVDKNVQITVELKNDLQISGTLHSVDQYLNIKINNVSVNDPERYPHLVRTRRMSLCIVGDIFRLVMLCLVRLKSTLYLAFLLLQLSVKNCFIRGSVVRYIHLNPTDVDTELLQDFCRKEAMQQRQAGTTQLATGKGGKKQ